MRLACTLICLLVLISARAQFTEKIETDRPDQTETPFLTPKRYFQAELGFNAERYANNNWRTVHPTALLKYGLSNRVELRLESTMVTEYEHLIPNPNKNTMLLPLELGAKIRLFEEKGWRPKTSLIAHVGIPAIAAKTFRSLSAGYTARFTFQNSLSPVVGLGYNLGIEGGAGEPTAFFYTLAPGFNIGSHWYAYAEAFGSFFDGRSEHNLDGGIAYLPSNNTKIDLSSGFGLGNSYLSHYVAIGFSFRLPVGRR